MTLPIFEEFRSCDADREQRVEQLVSQRQPFIVRGYAQSWPAITRWTLPYLRACAGASDTIQVESFSGTRRKHQAFKAQDALARLPHAGGDFRHICSWQLTTAHEQLLGDFSIPDWFATDVGRYFGVRSHSLRWIFLSDGYTATPTHLDAGLTSAWHVLVRGQKRWRATSGGALQDAITLDGEVDLYSETSLQHVSDRGLAIREVTQSPGDLVWIPTGSLHAVRNEAFSVAVTQNYADLTNCVQMYSYAAQLRRTRHHGSPFPESHLEDVTALKNKASGVSLSRSALLRLCTDLDEHRKVLLERAETLSRVISAIKHHSGRH